MIDWTDSSCAWWAKLSRAREHLARLRHLEQAYLADGAWSTVYEPTEEEFWFDVRLHVDQSPPIAISLTAGDCLHNLSSALDAVAYGIAEVNVGERLAHDEMLQRASAFPVMASRQALDRWAGNDSLRRELFTEDDLDLLWKAQTFYWTGEAVNNDWIDAKPGSAEWNTLVQRDPLQLLRSLHNVDKHRRVHIALHGPDVPHWGTSGESLREVRMAGIWKDGAVVARVYDPPSTALDAPMEWDLRLYVAEQGERVKLVDRLGHLHGSVRQSIAIVTDGMMQRAESQKGSLK